EGVVSLRAAFRSAFAISARVFATVLRLTLASFARSVVEASGSALSAASARSRASLGALRRYLRLRRPPRARLLDRGERVAVLKQLVAFPRSAVAGRAHRERLRPCSVAG